MVEVSTNWVGKLQELGQKCRFVPVIDVGESENFSINNPSFKCIVDIKELSIHVESRANNKKMAKTAAAKSAYEKICEQTNVPHSTSTDKIAGLLKDLNVKDDEMTIAANFFKRMTKLPKLNPSNTGYTELKEEINKVNCSLDYNHDDNKQKNEPEYRFRCEVRPEGRSYPVIYGFGWSSSDKEEAREAAVKQLINALNVYSNNSPIKTEP